MKVSLRKITLQDTANIVKWRNSEDVRKNLFTQDDLTEEQHIAWFHSKVESGSCAQYIIEVTDGANKVDIGTTFIKNLNEKRREGEFGIFIGEAKYKGKHLGYQATIEMIRLGFEQFDLAQICLSVFADNAPAIRAYEKAGFMISHYLDEKINNKVVIYMTLNRNRWMLLDEQ